MDAQHKRSQFREQPQCDGHVVDEDPIAPRPTDLATHDQFHVRRRDSSLLEHQGCGPLDRVEHAGHRQQVLASTNQVGSSSASGQQSHRVDDDRLTGARSPADDVQTWSELDRGILDHCKILDMEIS